MNKKQLEQTHKVLALAALVVAVASAVVKYYKEQA